MNNRITPVFSGSEIDQASDGIIRISFARLGVSTRPRNVIVVPQSFDGCFGQYIFDDSANEVVLHIWANNNGTLTKFSGTLRYGITVFM